MKKNILLLFLLAIILTFLSGCSGKNSSKDLILNPPTFKLNDTYTGQLELSLDEVITYEGNLTLIVDGQEYLDDTLVLGIGVHNLEAYAWENDIKSTKVSTTVTIIEDNKGLVYVYSEPDVNSEVIDIININSITTKDYYDYIFEFIDGELISWEEVELLDSKKGYYIGEFVPARNRVVHWDSIVLKFENGEEIVFNGELDNYTYAVRDQILSQYGYFVRTL